MLMFSFSLLLIEQAKNREHFEPFVDDEDFDAYVARKRNPKCFGNHTEIQAMSELYNRHILVYCYSDGASVVDMLWPHLDSEPINTFVAESSTEPPIRVSYHNNIHYNAIIDPSLPSFGVGLGFSDLKPGVRMRYKHGCSSNRKLTRICWRLLPCSQSKT